MKSHITVKLKDGIPTPDVPHWMDILSDKSNAASTLHPEIDRILVRHRLPVWVTREFRPAEATWSEEELLSRLDRIYRLVLHEDSRIPPDLIEEIRLVPAVAEARMGLIGQADLPPMRPQTMSVSTDRASREAIFLPEAHRYTRGHRSITVAVLDTGIGLDHPELADALLPGRDFVHIIDGATKFFGDHLDADPEPDDEVGHGTHVAGIIAGKGLDMPAGVVPECRILPVRVLAAMRRGDRRVGAGLIENIDAGVKFAVDAGADVINMSLGVRHSEGGLPHREVVDYASRKGVTVVAASGNDGSDQLYFPSAFATVVAVGAADEGGEVAAFSTYGPHVSLVAPGENVYSSFLEREYAFASGTSHAAPFVAGGVAMLKSYAHARGRRLSDRQVKHVLKHTADKVDQRFKHPKAGFGRLNLVDALRLLDHKLNQRRDR